MREFILIRGDEWTHIISESGIVFGRDGGVTPTGKRTYVRLLYQEKL